MLLARFANFSLSKSRPQIANRFALARTASILRSSASRLRRAASSASSSAARASLNGRSKHHNRPSRRNHVAVGNRVEKRPVVRHEHECAAIRAADTTRRRASSRDRDGSSVRRATTARVRRSPRARTSIDSAGRRTIRRARKSNAALCDAEFGEQRFGAPALVVGAPADRSSTASTTLRSAMRCRQELLHATDLQAARDDDLAGIGRARAARKSSSVDLPQPLWPTRPTREPTETVNSRSLNSVRSPTPCVTPRA